MNTILASKNILELTFWNCYHFFDNEPRKVVGIARELYLPVEYLYSGVNSDADLFLSRTTTLRVTKIARRRE